MVVAAVSSVTLPTTDSPAHLARAVLDSHVMTFDVDVSESVRSREPEHVHMDRVGQLLVAAAPLQLSPPAASASNFGYRNTKLQGRFTSSMKTRINDDNFEKDLYEYCARFPSSVKGAECRGMADWYVFLRRRLRRAGNPVDLGEDAHDRLKRLMEVICWISR